MTESQSKIYAELYDAVLKYRRTGYVVARDYVAELAAQLGLTVQDALELGQGPDGDNYVADLVTYGRNPFAV